MTLALITIPALGLALCYAWARRVLLHGCVAFLCLCVAAYALMGVYDNAQKRRPWSLVVDVPGQFDMNAPLYTPRDAPHDRMRAFPTYADCRTAGSEVHTRLLRRYKSDDIVIRCTQ